MLHDILVITKSITSFYNINNQNHQLFSPGALKISEKKNEEYNSDEKIDLFFITLRLFFISLLIY